MMHAPEDSFPGFGTSIHLSACSDYNMIFTDRLWTHLCVNVCQGRSAVRGAVHMHCLQLLLSDPVHQQG